MKDTDIIAAIAPDAVSLMDKAIAEIKRLRQENATLTAERDEAEPLLEELWQRRTESTEMRAEIERLRAGGCARDQNTTQYCAEAVALQEKCNKLHERCMHLENYIDIECANKETVMEGEMTADIRIVCEEIRKKRRVSVVLEAWSEELDTVLLKIEDHDLESDLKSGTEVKVPYQSLMHGLDAVRNIIRA